MCDTERGEDAEDPAKGISNVHGHWDVLEHKNYHHAETACYEVQEEGRNLRIDI